MLQKRKLCLRFFLVIFLIQVLISSSSANSTSNNSTSNNSNEIESYDPNWLYSSIAQCSAAIVGVIGALITSKLIMVSGEKSSLLKRKGELEIEIGNLEKRNSEKLKYCEEMDLNDAKEYITEFLEEIDTERIKEAKSFEEIWDLYCDFYDNDQLKCNEFHKKVFVSLINAEEDEDD